MDSARSLRSFLFHCCAKQTLFIVVVSLACKIVKGFENLYCKVAFGIFKARNYSCSANRATRAPHHHTTQYNKKKKLSMSIVKRVFTTNQLTVILVFAALAFIIKCTMQFLDSIAFLFLGDLFSIVVDDRAAMRDAPLKNIWWMHVSDSAMKISNMATLYFLSTVSSSSSTLGFIIYGSSPWADNILNAQSDKVVICFSRKEFSLRKPK